MATINPSQDYDIIHTLTYASSGGTDPIILFRGDGDSAYSGTVYYRAGTSGAWTSLSVSGWDTTFSITSTTMQIAHDWNKSGNDYMMPSFHSGTMTGIAISQKAVLSGIVGHYFMFYYAGNCSNLTTLDVPDTSGLTSTGESFMYAYASGCSTLTTLAVPDTSALTSVGDWFMSYYASGCSNLTTLEAPDTSGLTSVSYSFMSSYASNCSSLTTLILPKAGWFKTNNVNWNVPSGRLGLLRGQTSNPTDQADWQALTVSGKTLHTNYIRNSSDVWLVPGWEVQNSSTSVVMSGISITRNASLSAGNLSVATAIGNIAITGGRSLSVANHTVVTSTTSPTLAAVRNLVTGNLILLVAASQSNIHKLIGIDTNNLSLVTVAYTPTATSEMILSMNNLLVAIDEDSVEMTALRSMGVEPISVAPIVSATAAQIGYPVFGIGSDEIYALGTIPEGEYNISTLNNNEIYEVVEQDGI